MNAVLLHRDRLDLDDGSVVEMVLWSLPRPIEGSRHCYKYRLYFGRDGHLLVLYDNERGKGDHRHRGRVEESYEFTTVDQLVRDFLTDVAEERER